VERQFQVPERCSGPFWLNLTTVHLYVYVCLGINIALVLLKALKEREELTKKYSDTTAKNDQLSEECRRYVEEFKRMEEMIKNLKREIDERNRQARFALCQMRHFISGCMFAGA